MFNKALVATDSSASSFAVVGCAGSLYSLGVRECILAQCYLIRERVAFPSQIQEYIETELQQQKKILEDRGIRTTVVTKLGLAGREIPIIAEQMNCSIIVIGSHGRSLLSDIILGSTATEIIHQATKPVFVIHLKEDGTGHIVCVRMGNKLFHHVLYATDFSDYSIKAFEYLCKFVECGSEFVTIIHVQDKIKLASFSEDKLEEFNSIDRQRLGFLKDRLEKIGKAKIEIVITYGHPANEILNRVKLSDISTVIMGSHGRGFISELFVGSVSYNVVRHCNASVLLIPKK